MQVDITGTSRSAGGQAHGTKGGGGKVMFRQGQGSLAPMWPPPDTLSSIATAFKFTDSFSQHEHGTLLVATP
jgi:hypothetical protein